MLLKELYAKIKLVLDLSAKRFYSSRSTGTMCIINITKERTDVKKETWLAGWLAG